MQRSDRLLGILLQLRSNASVSAVELADRFDVSVRTIYRDIDALSELGIPVYAETGRGGGYRLVEGYHLPAIAFSEDEAVALAVSLGLLRSLRTRPLARELDQAEGKLLAALPARLRETLASAQRFTGFEHVGPDPFHPEPEHPRGPDESPAIDAFIRARIAGLAVELDYRSPYRGTPLHVEAVPYAVLWDRDNWYLVGAPLAEPEATRLWRADRVQRIAPLPGRTVETNGFDLRPLLGHAWLRAAMRSWARESPVRIRLTAVQAARLRRDWYFRWAHYEPLTDGRELLTYGEDNQEYALELLRWLGPGAELLEPRSWRRTIAEQLRALAETYEEDA